MIGPDVPDYRFIIVVGSQDGFGPGKWRDVDATAKTWRLGGGADPSPVDGIDYDPNILDVILPEGDQSAMLASYDVDQQQYAILTGFELPEVAQQVYGAKVAGTTSSSAIIEWSTTQPEAGLVSCIELASSSTMEWNESTIVPESSSALSHTLQLNGLEASSSYACNITVGDSPAVSIAFNTSNEIDDTPPEVLNLALEIVPGGKSFRITWYTDEATTESIEVGGQAFTGDIVALRKNHDMTINPNPELIALQTYTVTVTAIDASGNSNTSSIEFTIPEEDAASPLPDPDSSGEESGGNEEGISQEMVLIIAFIVALLVLGAIIRTRRSEQDILAETLAVFDDTMDED